MIHFAISQSHINVVTIIFMHPSVLLSGIRPFRQTELATFKPPIRRIVLHIKYMTYKTANAHTRCRFIHRQHIAVNQFSITRPRCRTEICFPPPSKVFYGGCRSSLLLLLLYPSPPSPARFSTWSANLGQST